LMKKTRSAGFRLKPVSAVLARDRMEWFFFW
jgi:hypothetical protein